jgi:hypothetical protein
VQGVLQEQHRQHEASSRRRRGRITVERSDQPADAARAALPPRLRPRAGGRRRRLPLPARRRGGEGGAPASAGSLGRGGLRRAADRRSFPDLESVPELWMMHMLLFFDNLCSSERCAVCLSFSLFSVTLFCWRVRAISVY